METQTFNGELKERLDKLWSSKIFHRWIDLMRIVTVALLIFIIFYLISEIDAVKLLNSDVCAICMEKTGCFCSCINP